MSVPGLCGSDAPEAHRFEECIASFCCQIVDKQIAEEFFGRLKCGVISKISKLRDDNPSTNDELYSGGPS